MSLLSRLFGGGGGGRDDAGADLGHEEYAGFVIHADPARDGPRWRIGARIEKEIDGTVKTHRMIRADTLESAEAAAAASIAKAKILIDQQGETIFRED
jgi:hypothetical protein